MLAALAVLAAIAARGCAATAAIGVSERLDLEKEFDSSTRNSRVHSNTPEYTSNTIRIHVFELYSSVFELYSSCIRVYSSVFEFVRACTGHHWSACRPPFRGRVARHMMRNFREPVAARSDGEPVAARRDDK